MEYTSLGATGISVSRVCLGSWQVSGWSKSDPALFRRIVREALEEGVSFFDTSPRYGGGLAEELLGDELKARRTDITLASKFWFSDSSPARLRKSLEQTLKRLQTDYLDLYQQHWPHPRIPFYETRLELEKLKEEGKIRGYGVCNWMMPEWDKAGELAESISTLQGPHNLLWRSLEREVFKLCEKNAITTLLYSPLAQGILAASDISELSNVDEVRAKNILFGDAYREDIHQIRVALFDLSREISEEGHPESRVTRAQIALRWIVQQNPKSIVIVGCTSADQLKENCDIFRFSLSEKQWNHLEKLSRRFITCFGEHQSIWNVHSVSNVPKWNTPNKEESTT